MAAVMLLMGAFVVVADTSDASPGTAEGSLIMHAGGVNRNVSKSFVEGDTRYCYEADSDADRQMQDFLRYPTASFPAPLTGPDPNVKEYAVYEFTSGGGSFVTPERHTFTVAKDGDVRVKASSYHEFQVNNSKNTSFDFTEERKAGEYITISCDIIAESPGQYWFTVKYEISNVRVPDSSGMQDRYVLYGAFGIVAGATLIAMRVCRGSPLSSRPVEKIKRTNPLYGRIAALLAVVAIVGAALYLPTLVPGDKDMDSLGLTEGLVLEIRTETVTDDGTTVEKEVYVTTYSVDVVSNGLVTYTRTVYPGSSGTVLSKDSLVKDEFSFKREIMGDLGATSQIMELMTKYGKVTTAKEIIDTGFGDVLCDVYKADHDGSSLTCHVRNGYIVKSVYETESGTSKVTETHSLTDIRYK